MCCCGPDSFRGVRKSVLSLTMIFAWIGFGFQCLPMLLSTILLCMSSAFFSDDIEETWAANGLMLDGWVKMSETAPLAWGLYYANGFFGFIRSQWILNSLVWSMLLTIGICGCYISKADTFRAVRATLIVFLVAYLVLLGIFVYLSALSLQVGNLDLGRGLRLMEGGVWALDVVREWRSVLKILIGITAAIVFPGVFAPIMAIFGKDIEPRAKDEHEYTPMHPQPMGGHAMVGAPVAANGGYYVPAPGAPMPPMVHPQGMYQPQQHPQQPQHSQQTQGIYD